MCLVVGIKSISENDRRDSFDTSSKTTTSNKEKYKSSPTTINSFHSDNSIKRPIQREENCVLGQLKIMPVMTRLMTNHQRIKYQI